MAGFMLSFQEGPAVSRECSRAHLVSEFTISIGRVQVENCWGHTFVCTVLATVGSISSLILLGAFIWLTPDTMLFFVAPLTQADTGPQA